MGDGVPAGFCILKDLTAPGDFPDIFLVSRSTYISRTLFFVLKDIFRYLCKL